VILAYAGGCQNHLRPRSAAGLHLVTFLMGEIFTRELELPILCLASPLAGGKGSPCEKEKGGLHEEKSQGRI
jgi:hypothetical protein